MSKQDILNDLTIQQATTLSLSIQGGENQRLAVVKTSDGFGYSGNIEDLLEDWIDLNDTDQQGVVDNFCSTSQVAGGRPDC